MITISQASYKLYGCPTCGCIHGKCPSVIKGVADMICAECQDRYYVAYNGHQDIVSHPRNNIPFHNYESPDIKPEYGEYWESRGVGFDLSGFVKSKKAGERLLEMVKDVLDVGSPKTWLDFRQNEPSWIQFKFQKEEFDLDKLDKLSKENKNIITREILQQSKLNQ